MAIAQRRWVSVFLAALLLLTGGGGAFGAYSFNYGNFLGSNVDFLNVREDTYTDNTALFGTPVRLVDSLAFTPTGFAAYSANGVADITDGQLTLTIDAKPGHYIDRILISERGDYTLAALAGTATAAVYAQVQVQVHELDGMAVTPFTISATVNFTPTAGQYSITGGLSNGQWQGTLDLDLDAQLAAIGKSGHATLVNFTMDNTLVALSQSGTVAHIAKKDYVQEISVMVPEPTTFLGAGLVLPMLLLRRRRVA